MSKWNCNSSFTARSMPARSRWMWSSRRMPSSRVMSVSPKGDGGIDTRRAERGQPARRNCDSDEHDGDRAKHDRVLRRDVEQKRREPPSSGKRRDEANADAHQRDTQTVA